MDMTSLSTSQSSAGAEKIVAKICVAALQASELMERFPASLHDPSLLEHLHRVSALLASWIRTFTLHGATAPADEQLDRVNRALYKLRRTCLDSVDMWSTSAASKELRAAVLGALGSVVECVEAVQSRWMRLSDMTNGVVDALIVMARATLNGGRDQAAIQPAYAHLERAIRISRAQQQQRSNGAQTVPAADLELAERLRVVSTALYVHGGGLYKEGLYGHAALYLKTSCEVAREAIELASSDASREPWTELKEQLSKRLALHGFCCFKFGDRKVRVFNRAFCRAHFAW